MQQLPVAVIVNLRGGSADDALPDAIERALEAAGVVERRMLVLGDGEDPAQRAREAVSGGAGCVVAVGGDGTVSAVASALLGTSVALGVIPRGTSNSIARALGLPSGLDEACAAIAGGALRTIDTALAAGRPMLLMATIGLHARAITETDDEAKASLGVLAYLSTGLSLMLDGEDFEVTVQVDRVEPFTLRAHALTVANLAPARTFLAQGPSELSPDDRLLDLTVVAFDGVLDALVTAAHLFRTAVDGEPAARDNVGWTRARSVRVEATPPQKVMVDGEEVGLTPFEVSVRPASLRVLVPSPAP